MRKVKSKKQTGRVVQRSKKTKKSNSSKGKSWLYSEGSQVGYSTHQNFELKSVYGSKGNKQRTNNYPRYPLQSLKDPKDDYLKHLEYMERREQLKNKQLHILRVKNELLAA